MTVSWDFEYYVPGNVPLVLQDTENVCWAATVTMLLSWRDNTSYDPLYVMMQVGQYYAEQYSNDEALSIDEEPAFFAACGLHAEPPMNYSIQGLLALLQQYGPLLISTQDDPTRPALVHARVVTGMYGDGSVDGTFLVVNDPQEVQIQKESFRVFAEKFEGAAVSLANLVIQVVHC